MSAPGGEERERWLASLRALVPVPAVHACPTLSPGDARALLRCSPAVWDMLRTEGFPVHDTADGERHDEHDVFNLALYSGSRVSVPEMALRFAFGFVRQPLPSWCRRRTWRMTATLSCPAESCESDAEWHLWAPLGSDGVAEHAPQRHTESRRSLRVDHVVSTDGVVATLESPVLRRLVGEVAGRRLRYARMPAALQGEPEWMIAHGLLDCVTGSVFLARLAGDAGFTVRTRSGWLAGPVVSEHCWVELLDVDGSWKCVDLAFRALGEALYPERRDFSDFCIGSRLDRLIPTACPAGEPLATHRCGGAHRQVRSEVSVNAMDASAVPAPSAARLTEV